MAEKGSGTVRSCLICVSIVLGAAVIGLVIGVAILASQLSEHKDRLAAQELEKPKPTGAPTSTPTPTPTEPPMVPAPEQLSPGSFVKAGVATDHEECNTIGASMLARGGSVVDALISAELCIGIKAPFFSGIGGGFLMTIYDIPKGGTQRVVRSLNSREVAPLAATQDMFKYGNVSSVYGGAAIAVPSVISGLYEAWLQYGRLPWRDLVQPAVHMARDGSKVSGLLEEIIKTTLYLDVPSLMEQYPEMKAQYHHADGRGYVEGEMIKMEKLAVTLQTIADEGAEAFYNGSLTEDIIKDIQDAGGIITAEDLAIYRPVWQTPVSSTLKNGGYTFHGPPPPSSAAVIQFMMNIMDGYNFSRDALEADPGLLWHRFVEALKFGYGKRSALGDADFVDVSEIVADLTSSDKGREYRLRINDDAILGNFTQYEPAFLKEDSQSALHTSQISVIGDDGSAVVMTTTINAFFGSFVQGSRTGILFNNEMDDFSTPGLVNTYGYFPSPSNFIEPGKHPMSSMSPSIVLDKEGKLRMAIGGAGGSRIITGIINSMVQHLWFDKPLHLAVAAPRLHHQLLPDELNAEPNVPKAVVDSLKARGHNIVPIPDHFYYGVVSGVADTCSKCACAGGSCALCDLQCLQASGDWRSHTFDAAEKASRPDGF